MTAEIHASSVVHDGARIGANVSIGPFCEVGADVVLGDGVTLHGRVTLMGSVHLGVEVEVFPGATLGGKAQSLGSKVEPDTGVVIGPRTILRECVSIHAGSPKGTRYTRVGADCFLMAYSHVGHDCQIGNHNVLANSVQFAGHITTGDHVWVGGSVAIHQFTEIGDHAFVAGGAILVGDVIPFGMVAGNRASLKGLNIKGLSRRGFSRHQLHDLRRAYKAVFEGHGTFLERVSAAEERFVKDADAKKLFEFIRKDRSRALCLPDPS
ncbi:MAG: acyl-ACP--UDP-N-acetylglucosamine O-acyltransferase [Pseudomonadota bacterium]